MSMRDAARPFRPALLLLAALIVAGCMKDEGLPPHHWSAADAAVPGRSIYAADAGLPAQPASAAPVVRYRTAKVADLDLFYREAGPADAPTVLLLHGFPTN